MSSSKEWIKIGKSAGFCPLYWGAKTKEEFISKFKGVSNRVELEAIYKGLPKPKKAKVEKPKKEVDAGHIPDNGEDK